MDYNIFTDLKNLSQKLFKSEPFIFPNRFRHKLWENKRKRQSTNRRHEIAVSKLYMSFLIKDVLKIHEAHVNAILTDYFQPYNYGKHKHITYTDIMKFKSLLPHNLVISIKDKNQGKFDVECPHLFQTRTRKEIDECKSLINIKHKTETEIIREIRNIYDQEGLKEYGRWINGTLPYMYVIPKDKDPPNKSRLIASYSNHPLRNIYRKVSRVITWCLKENERAGHFT